MSIAEIHQNHEILRQSYPGARIISSSFQNFLEDISGIAPQLELFDRDISDSWLQGIGSDPKRVQQYLALQRALASCFDNQLCTKDDEELINASRFLVKIPGKYVCFFKLLINFFFQNILGVYHRSMMKLIGVINNLKKLLIQDNHIIIVELHGLNNEHFLIYI